jgi:hypothetical protein
MATTFNATKSFGAPYAVAGVGDGQQAKVMVCEYTWSAALVINDIFQSPMLPKGAVVYDVMVCTSDMDTATSVTLDVGYGTDPDYFVAASTIGQTGGVVRASAATAKPLTLTVNDTIDVLVKAAPGTSTTSGSISMAIFYVMSNA